MKELSMTLKEVFTRLLGYFGRDRRKNQGPTVLGMETDKHKRIPDAEEIRQAVKEAQDLLEKEKMELHR